MTIMCARYTLHTQDTIRDWDRLPETTVQAPNLNAFKRRLSNPNECEQKNSVHPTLGL